MAEANGYAGPERRRCAAWKIKSLRGRMVRMACALMRNHAGKDHVFTREHDPRQYDPQTWRGRRETKR